MIKARIKPLKDIVTWFSKNGGTIENNYFRSYSRSVSFTHPMLDLCGTTQEFTVNTSTLAGGYHYRLDLDNGGMYFFHKDWLDMVNTRTDHLRGLGKDTVLYVSQQNQRPGPGCVLAYLSHIDDEGNIHCFREGTTAKTAPAIFVAKHCTLTWKYANIA